MKREDAMQGYWSVVVDEKRPSLAVDDAVLVGAPAWWRTVAMDVVEDGGDGCGGGRRRWMGWRTEEAGVGKREVERKGRNMYSGRACLKCEEIYELSPRSKFPTSQQ